MKSYEVVFTGHKTRRGKCSFVFKEHITLENIRETAKFLKFPRYKIKDNKGDVIPLVTSIKYSKKNVTLGEFMKDRFIPAPVCRESISK